MVYRFGEVEVDVARRHVRAKGEVRALPAKAFDILVYLVENRGRVVGRRELLDIAWPDVVVEDGSLTQNVSVLRKAIGDSGETPVIRTVSGVGYQFTASLNDELPAAGARHGHGRVARTTGIVVIGLLALLLGLMHLPSRGTTRREPISIAVLPARAGNFAGAGGAEGLRVSGMLIAELSKDTRLSVRPMSDVVEFADPRRDTALEAGLQLGVALVMEGSIASSGKSLELQLIDVERRRVIWSGVRVLDPPTNSQALSRIVVDATGSAR